MKISSWPSDSDIIIEKKEVQDFNGKVLIIWWGGREHALAWKIAKSEKVTHVFVAPWNAGTKVEWKVFNIDFGIENIESLLHFANKMDVWLTIVGPEGPLVEWIVDKFKSKWLNIFGPSKAAAQLEWSKIFTKKLLVDNNIPTANYAEFNDKEQAFRYIIKNNNFPIVIKADWLAEGKWVIIAHSNIESLSALISIMEDKVFGSAGEKIIIEEFIEWEEVSMIFMVDNNGNILPMASSQDHKPLWEGNTGPNTWWMWAISPALIMTDELYDEVIRTIINPTLEWMKKIGAPFSWFLYAGLMITKDWPKVLEYNVRFGDPEAQPILMRLESDLVDLLLAWVNWTLDDDTLKVIWSSKSAVSVVMAAWGYPGSYSIWDEINWLDQAWEDEKIFHASTKEDDWKVFTNWWRVLTVTALTHNIKAAQQKANALVKKVTWKGAQSRRDIGYLSIKREEENTD